MRIREGDPLEIYTSRDGEVIFKKYSLLGGVEDFASELCETMSRSTGSVCAVTDRDTIIAVAGGSKRELMGKRITPELEEIMEGRKIYQYSGDGGPFRSLRDWIPSPPPWPLPFWRRAICWVWCSSSARLPGLLPENPNSSWPRPSPPFWGVIWKADLRAGAETAPARFPRHVFAPGAHTLSYRRSRVRRHLRCPPPGNPAVKGAGV